MCYRFGPSSASSGSIRPANGQIVVVSPKRGSINPRALTRNKSGKRPERSAGKQTFHFYLAVKTVEIQCNRHKSNLRTAALPRKRFLGTLKEITLLSNRKKINTSPLLAWMQEFSCSPGSIREASARISAGTCLNNRLQSTNPQKEKYNLNVTSGN